jgi:hypothetical protein
MTTIAFNVSGFTKTDFNDGSANVNAPFSILTLYGQVPPDQRYYPLVNAYADNTGYYFEYDFDDLAVSPTMFYFAKRATSVGLGNFKVQGSMDHAAWADLATITDLGAAPNQMYNLTTATAGRHFKYLRLVGTGGSYTWPDANTMYDKQWLWVAFAWGSTRPASDVGDDGSGGGANDPGGINDPSTHPGFEMSDLSVYAGDQVLDWLKGNAMGTPPAGLYVALYDGDPDDTVTPGVEITNANGLTRQPATFGSIVARYMLNNAPLNFGILSGGDKSCAAFALFDDDTAGNRYTLKILSAPVTLTDGTPIKIAAGKLPVYY